MPDATAFTVSRAFDAPARTVWVALCDPVTVADALPADSTLAPSEGDLPAGSLARLLAAEASTRGERTVDVGDRYALAIDGERRQFDATVAVTERDYPRLAVAVTRGEQPGAGVEATADALATIRVTEDGDGCQVTVDVRIAAESANERDASETVADAIEDVLDGVAGHVAATRGPTSERAVKDPDWR